MLQTRITNVLRKNICLTNVIEIMLFRRILPCQRRASPMWELKPEDPRTLELFYGATHGGMWKLLFKAQKSSWPMETEDMGISIAYPASPVSVRSPRSHI